VRTIVQQPRETLYTNISATAVNAAAFAANRRRMPSGIEMVAENSGKSALCNLLQGAG
jgi:hypothetical protein